MQKYTQRYTLTKQMLFKSNVRRPRKPFITNPARIHFISEIPDPAAYGAKERIINAQIAANNVWI